MAPSGSRLRVEVARPGQPSSPRESPSLTGLEQASDGDGLLPSTPLAVGRLLGLTGRNAGAPLPESRTSDTAAPALARGCSFVSDAEAIRQRGEAVPLVPLQTDPLTGADAAARPHPRADVPGPRDGADPAAGVDVRAVSASGADRARRHGRDLPGSRHLPWARRRPQTTARGVGGRPGVPGPFPLRSRSRRPAARTPRHPRSRFRGDRRPALHRHASGRRSRPGHRPRLWPTAAAPGRQHRPAQVAAALDAAHAAGLVHRDIKPANILITGPEPGGAGGDFVYVADFGIARAVDGSASGSLTSTGTMVGSLDYIAPERFDRDPGDRRVDIYALGCVLFQALTGRRPFPVEGMPAIINAHLNTPPPAASGLRPSIPAGLDAVIARAMAKHPTTATPAPPPSPSTPAAHSTAKPSSSRRTCRPAPRPPTSGRTAGRPGLTAL